MSLDKSIKKYKQGLTDSGKTLEELEARAAEIVNAVDDAHDTEAAFQDAQSELARVAADKENIKEQLSESVLTGTGNVEELREKYAQLAADEDQLQAQLGDLTKRLEACEIDKGQVATIRAQLRRVNAGGSTLVDAVKKTVQSDTDALSGRVRAVEDQLPPADDLDTLYALGFTEKADGYAEAIERNERIRPGSGDQMRDALHREVQRVLQRV